MIRAVLFLLLWANQADPDAVSAQAAEAAKAGRFDDAERLWKKALAMAPGQFSANFNLGLLHFQQGRFAQAEPWLRRAVEAQPKDFNAHYVYGATLARLERGDEALRQWRAALELKPDQVKLMQIMAVEYSKGRYFREAAGVAERALRMESGDANLYLIAIKAHQDAGDHPAALRVAELFAKRFPDLPRANFELGFELHRAGRPAEGLPYLEKAMAADNRYEEPFYFYGEVLMNERRFEDALTPLEKAIAIRRDYMAAWIALAKALMGLERYAEAERRLLESVTVDPRHPQPHLLLSQLYFRMGNEEKAAQEKEVSLRLRRENPQAMESPQGRPFR